jgi:phosphoadenylyl-sulfate reductase (thioredoxin)
MMELVRERYGVRVEAVSPEPAELVQIVSGHGPNLFYRSPELRALCCEVRKVKPLQRKLREFRAWAAGLRREQAETRAGVRKAQEIDGRVRLCPLADWSAQDVDRYIRDRHVPVHPLYARGYASIGCAPCTRAISAGESERAGRWWWEEQIGKECGIHFAANGRVVRNA